MNLRFGRVLAKIWLGLFVLGLLYVVLRVYLGGHVVIGSLCLAGAVLLVYIYVARGGLAARYLVPGLAGISIFVVLPLVYTIWVGFTNYSSQNLLTFERSTEALLEETSEGEGGGFRFTLHGDGPGFRLLLEVAESAAPADGAAAAPPATYATPVLTLASTAASTVDAVPAAQVPGLEAGEALPLKDIIARRAAIRAVTVRFPDGTTATMSSLREFSPRTPTYHLNPDRSLTKQKTGAVLRPNFDTGFYEAAGGEQIRPGFRVGVGFGNYVRIFTDSRFRGPFLKIFLWTVVFAGLTVVLTVSLGMILAELLGWEQLRFRGAYRILLFLPYAVPGFISILVFKGLFNRNFGEINFILDSLFGIRPNWMGDATLAKAMIIIVNTWLGYPYFMLLCMGLQKAIPKDLYEASAIAGAGPVTNFLKITWPIIRKPLMPLVVSSFAFNFNNFVLIYLLTGGRPDFLGTVVPAGETDILVSYTYRIAFEDSGQAFGLAAAISTIIFIMVAVVSLVNLRLTKANQEDKS